MRDERATVVDDGGGRALWATVVACCCMVSVETETGISDGEDEDDDADEWDVGVNNVDGHTQTTDRQNEVGCRLPSVRVGCERD